MLRTHQIVLCLSLLPSLPAGCDVEAHEELELQAEAELELEADLEQIGETDELELAPPPAEAYCSDTGKWEYKRTSLGCGTCFEPVLQVWGQKFNYSQRWCWDGPPACGGCGPWQYYGWGCFEGCQ
jgi:hypothetical protein